MIYIAAMLMQIFVLVILFLTKLKINFKKTKTIETFLILVEMIAI